MFDCTNFSSTRTVKHFPHAHTDFEPRFVFAESGLNLEVHSNLDLSAVNLGVYLDLVANSMLTENLLIKNSEFKRFELFWKVKIPRFSSQKIVEMYHF